MSIMMYMLRQMRKSHLCPQQLPSLNSEAATRLSSSIDNKAPPTASPRMQQFKQKLRETTPIDKLDEIVGKHPDSEEQPLEPFPNNTNPKTGEIGGPKGPEPTRYGDWERKGRVTDF